MSIVHLVDGLRGLHLHLAGRRVDALGDLRLDRDQQLTSATFQEVITHSDPRALVLCDVILSTSANPANTGNAAVQCTEQLLCLCWLDWQT